MFIRPIPLIFLAFAASNAMAASGNSPTDLTSSLNDNCGQGQVINTTTLYTTDGRDMKVTIQSCGTPPSGSPLTRDIGLEKRQMPSVCSQTCVQSCHFNGSAAPDCTALISTINSLAGQTFIAPPGTRTIFEVGTCEVSFIHGLGVPVEGCFSWMSPLVATMNQCFNSPPNNEGECFQGNAAFSWDLVLAKSGTF